MGRQAIAASRRQAFSAQITAEGSVVHSRYGPRIGWDKLINLLQDRACVFFPCELRFDASPLLPGEFAHALAKGATPEEGFTIYLHPLFEQQREQVPYLVLHQLVLVNHGETATADDAEVFGSLASGLSKDEYYRVLCELSDQVGGDDLV